MTEKLPTRRRVALRRIAIMAAVLFVINFFMHIGMLLPRQAIHEVEERNGTGWTRTVDRMWVPEIHTFHLAYLTQSENVTLFSSAYLTVLGWMPAFSNALDCSEEAPIHAGQSAMSRDEGEVWFFFGRVDDPEIERVELSLCAEEYDDRSYAQTGREVRRITDVELLEQSGRRYFLVKDGREWDYDRDNQPRPLVLGYNAAGEEIFCLDIQEKNFSHWV